MKYCVVIPARKNSSRLPNKPLLDICGKSMLNRTFNQVAKSVPKELIFVATDCEEIFNHCQKFTQNIFVTNNICETGTDRVAEFAKIHPDFNYYINVQGDEPLIDPEDISRIIQAQLNYPNNIINGFSKILLENEYRSLTIPKMVISDKGYLMYSSRNAIPVNKLNIFIPKMANKQVCIYSFPKELLSHFGSGVDKSPNERIEDIEIIRFLELGISVRMIECFGNSVAVDTLDDLERVRKIIFEADGFTN
jgi:3-deoxy-manno-octulosonate cytidylyltransferase (CMP-KDO synthetase)